MYNSTSFGVGRCSACMYVSILSLIVSSTFLMCLCIYDGGKIMKGMS